MAKRRHRLAGMAIAAIVVTVLLVPAPAASMSSELGAARPAVANQWPEIAVTREVTLGVQSD